jgi:PAS domain S-box-containing protein
LLLNSPAFASALKIRAGLEQNPPLSFIDDNGQPAGLLVETLDYIARREGWRIEYVPDSFKRCLEKLDAAEIDLMVTIAYSEERAKRYDFNRVNVVANWGMLYTPAGGTIQSYFDLEGRKVAVMSKDIHHRNFRRLLENFDIKVDYLEFDNFEQIFAALDSGKAEAGVVSRFYALSAEHHYDVHGTPLIFSPIEVRYATAKGANSEILLALDRNLEKLKNNPKSAYYRALDRWMGGISKSTLPKWIMPLFYALGGTLLTLAGFALLLRRQVQLRTRNLREEMNRRLHAQDELRLAEEKYRSLVENANAIILHWDTQGAVTFLNDFGERLFGYRNNELIGQNVVGTIVPDHESTGRDLARMIHDICTSPEDFQINENENCNKNGDRIWISWRNRPVRDANGELRGILSVGIDISERVKAEQARQEYDQVKDAFISTAAHELRTPLTSIIGYAELVRVGLESGATGSETLGEYVDIIYDKGERLERIIDDLLDISRISKGIALPLKLSKGSLPELAEQIVKEYRDLIPTHQFELSTQAESAIDIPFDRDRIIQVFDNLLSNAVKYSPQKSNIEVYLDTTDGHLQVRVTDQGIGMTDKQVDLVFDSFYRVDIANSAAGGLGLGMGISRQIVTAHQGEIWVDSTIDQGTSVFFTLPISADSAADA